MEAFNDSDSNSESSDEEEEETSEPTESSESEEMASDVPKEKETAASKEEDDNAYLDSLIAEAEQGKTVQMETSREEKEDPAYLDLGSLLQINTK